MGAAYRIGGFLDSGTVFSIRLEAPDGERRLIHGDRTLMLELLGAWDRAGRPEVGITEADDGAPAIRLLTDDEE